MIYRKAMNQCCGHDAPIGVARLVLDGLQTPSTISNSWFRPCLSSRQSSPISSLILFTRARQTGSSELAPVQGPSCLTREDALATTASPAQGVEVPPVPPVPLHLHLHRHSRILHHGGHDVGPHPCDDAYPGHTPCGGYLQKLARLSVSVIAQSRQATPDTNLESLVFSQRTPESLPCSTLSTQSHNPIVPRIARCQLPMPPG